MDKTKENGLKLAVLTMCCLNLTSMIISPTLPGVAKEFPDVSVTWIQNLSVMSSLTAILSANLSGYIMRYISKRNLAICSFLIYLFTGLAIIITKGFASMILLRCINGVSLGINSTLSTSMIAEYFKGEKQKTMMGLRMPFQNVSAMFFSILSGIMAQYYGWRISYFLFLTAFIPLGFGIGFLPDKKPVSITEKKNRKREFGYIELFTGYKGIVIGCLVHMMAVLATGINSTNIALLVSERGFGSSGLGGIVSAIYLLSASIAGMFFRRINRIFEKNLYPIACFFTMTGLFIASLCHSATVLILAEIIIGFWWSVFMARMNVTLACASDDRTRNIIFSFFIATMNLGTFFNPFVATQLTSLIGIGQGASSRMMVGAVIMAIISLTTYILNQKEKTYIQEVTF